MSDEEKKEEAQPEPPKPDDTPEGDKPPAVNVLDRVHDDIKRMEEIGKDFKKDVDAMRELQAQSVVAGRAVAGTIAVDPKVAEEKKLDEEVKQALESLGV